MSHQEQHFVGMHYCGRVYYSGEDGGYSDYLIPYYAHDEIYDNYSSQNVAKSKEAHAPAPCPGCNIELKNTHSRCVFEHRPYNIWECPRCERKFIFIKDANCQGVTHDRKRTARD